MLGHIHEIKVAKLLPQNGDTAYSKPIDLTRKHFSEKNELHFNVNVNC